MQQFEQKQVETLFIRMCVRVDFKNAVFCICLYICYFSLPVETLHLFELIPLSLPT